MSEEEKKKPDGGKNFLVRNFRSRALHSSEPEVREKKEKSVEITINTAGLAEKDIVQYQDLPPEDQVIVTNFKKTIPKNYWVMVDIRNGKIFEATGHVVAQVNTLRIHGDNYPANDLIKDLFERCRIINFN